MANNSSTKAKVEAQTKEMSIPEAAKYLGIKEQYVRHLIRKGKLPTRHETLNEEGTTWRHMIPVSALDAHKSSGRKTRRADGRSKWAIYATTDEMTKARAALKAAGLDLPIERAYKGKPKKEKVANATVAS